MKATRPYGMSRLRWFWRWLTRAPKESPSVQMTRAAKAFKADTKKLKAALRMLRRAEMKGATK